MDQSPLNSSELTLYNELHALIAFGFSSENEERIETLLCTDHTGNTEIDIVKVLTKQEDTPLPTPPSSPEPKRQQISLIFLHQTVHISILILQNFMNYNFFGQLWTYAAISGCKPAKLDR